MTSILPYQSERESDDETLEEEEPSIQPEPPSQGRLEQDVSVIHYSVLGNLHYEMLTFLTISINKCMSINRLFYLY